MGMRRTVLLLAVMAAALLMAGCSEPNVQQDNARGGMSKEEDKLNQRIAELEDKVNDQSTEQPSQETESAEDAALAAAQDYYAAAGGNYSYTCSNFSAVSQTQFTEDEWITYNTSVGSDAGTYSINSVEMLDDSTAEVQLTITAADGSSSERTTRFVLENGS